MKINGEVRIRENVTSNEIAEMVETIADIVIHRADNGNVRYFPYFFDNALRIAVFATIVDGVEVEDGEDIVDNNYDIKDADIASMIDKYIETSEVIDHVISYADDVIQFRKQEYLTSTNMLNDRLIKALEKESILNDLLFEIAKKQEKVLSQEISANEKQEMIMSKMSEEDILALQKRLANGDIDMSGMVAEVVEKYVSSDKSRDEKYKEIIDEKNDKIKELSKYKELYDARNVLADDGK